MSTSSSAAENDSRPDDQRTAAANAHLNPNEPATQAEAGTPQYGDFGKPRDQQSPAPRDGSNDNPDEFSEFREKNDNVIRPEHDIAGAYVTDSPNPNNVQQRGHVEQNRDPEAVRYAQGDTAGQNQKEEDNTRQAWAQDDERYAGGHTRNSWTAQNDQEHDPNDNDN